MQSAKEKANFCLSVLQAAEAEEKTKKSRGGRYITEEFQTSADRSHSMHGRKDMEKILKVDNVRNCRFQARRSGGHDFCPRL